MQSFSTTLAIYFFFNISKAFHFPILLWCREFYRWVSISRRGGKFLWNLLTSSLACDTLEPKVWRRIERLSDWLFKGIVSWNENALIVSRLSSINRKLGKKVARNSIQDRKMKREIADFFLHFARLFSMFQCRLGETTHNIFSILSSKFCSVVIPRTRQSVRKWKLAFCWCF